MSRFQYECPKCNQELYGDFGEYVYCSNCKINYDTDWDYTDCGEDTSMEAWIVVESNNIEEIIKEFNKWQKETLGFIRYKFESKSDFNGGKVWSIQIYLQTGKFSHTKPGGYETETKIINFINKKIGG